MLPALRTTEAVNESPSARRLLRNARAEADPARVWRAVRTGLAFAVFGAGGLVIGGLAFAVLRLMHGSRDRRERHAQHLVHRSFRLFTWFMEALGLIRISIVGAERLQGGPAALVIANHPTLIDVVLLIASMPQADCVVKGAAWRNRFLRGVVSGAGYVPNTEGPELIDTCAQRLRSGRWLLLFPEGTRSPAGGLGRFKRGVAHIALRAGVDVVPVVITCEPPTLGKGEPWYRVPARTAQLVLTIGERMRGPGADGREPDARGVREWTAAMRAHYEARLGVGGG